MAEPKILPPSLRSQKRYIVFEVISEKKVNYTDVVSAIWTSMLSFLGDAKSSEAKIWNIKNLYDDEQQKGVLRCAHDNVEHIRTVLSLVKIVGETNAIIRVVGVTGTIKAAKNKYLSAKTEV